MKVEDYFHANIAENHALLENLHDQCFTKCSKKTDIRYLTYDEGLCFRNCWNKFNNWYPRFEEQSRDAAFRTYFDMTMELEKDLKKQ